MTSMPGPDKIVSPSYLKLELPLRKTIGYFLERVDSLAFHWVGDYDNS